MHTSPDSSAGWTEHAFACQSAKSGTSFIDHTSMLRTGLVTIYIARISRVAWPQRRLPDRSVPVSAIVGPEMAQRRTGIVKSCPLVILSERRYKVAVKALLRALVDLLACFGWLVAQALLEGTKTCAFSDTLRVPRFGASIRAFSSRNACPYIAAAVLFCKFELLRSRPRSETHYWSMRCTGPAERPRPRLRTDYPAQPRIRSG